MEDPNANSSDQGTAGNTAADLPVPSAAAEADPMQIVDGAYQKLAKSLQAMRDANARQRQLLADQDRIKSEIAEAESELARCREGFDQDRRAFDFACDDAYPAAAAAAATKPAPPASGAESDSSANEAQTAG